MRHLRRRVERRRLDRRRRALIAFTTFFTFFFTFLTAFFTFFLCFFLSFLAFFLVAFLLLLLAMAERAPMQLFITLPAPAPFPFSLRQILSAVDSSPSCCSICAFLLRTHSTVCCSRENSDSSSSRKARAS